MSINNRLDNLRKVMSQRDIDFYIIPTADFHQSEYVGLYFKSREYITGFTGSQGTAIVTKNDALLWVDGRYFVQAEKELENSNIKLMKMGEENVPSILEFLDREIKEGDVLGFDGRVVSLSEGNSYVDICNSKNAKVVYNLDLIDEIWNDRPSISKEKSFTLDIKYTGESIESRILRVREVMREKKATAHILTTIDDICWLLNIRGNDVAFFPLVLSYAIITHNSFSLYIDEQKLDEKSREDFAKNNIKICKYNDIYEDVKTFGENEVILLDDSKINFALYNNIPTNVKKVVAMNPEIEFKTIKNEVEIENIKKAEIKDSIAHIRFMKWLKENVKNGDITELKATEKLDEFRKEMGNFISPSFDAISAYGSNGAIVHYSSSEETNKKIEEGNLYLSDTGSGFLEGSTDITRTFAFGDVSKDKKEHFTLVAIGNLRLANAKFVEGMTGANLDILARQPLFERGLNYNHGTGHGVGYLLGIHEGPASIMYRHTQGTNYPLKDGMIVTNEPGFYLQNSHGIRLENELLVRKGEKNAFGQFMYFETITFIPFDLDAIDVSLLNEVDKKLLNEYHAQVYDKIAPHLNEDEKIWLKEYTRSI